MDAKVGRGMRRRSSTAHLSGTLRPTATSDTTVNNVLVFFHRGDVTASSLGGRGDPADAADAADATDAADDADEATAADVVGATDAADDADNAVWACKRCCPGQATMLSGPEENTAWAERICRLG